MAKASNQSEHDRLRAELADWLVTVAGLSRELAEVEAAQVYPAAVRAGGLQGRQGLDEAPVIPADKPIPMADARRRAVESVQNGRGGLRSNEGRIADLEKFREARYEVEATTAALGGASVEDLRERLESDDLAGSERRALESRLAELDVSSRSLSGSSESTGLIGSLFGGDEGDEIRMALRARLGYVPDDEDLEEIKDAVFESGLWAAPSESELDQIVIGELLDERGGSQEFNEILESLGEGTYVRRGQIKYGNRWHDIDDDVMTELMGGFDESGAWKAPGKGGSWAPSSDDIGDEWETGGWLKDRSWLLPDILQEAELAGIHPTTLAAGIELTGGWIELDEEERKAVVQWDPRSQGHVGELAAKSWGTSFAGGKVRVEMNDWNPVSGMKFFKLRMPKVSVDYDDGRSTTFDYHPDAQRRARSTKAAGKGTEKQGTSFGSFVGRQMSGRAKATTEGFSGPARKAYDEKVGVFGRLFQKQRQQKAQIKTVAGRLGTYQKRWGTSQAAILGLQDESLADRFATGKTQGDDLFRVDVINRTARTSLELTYRYNRDRLRARQQYNAYARAWENYYSSSRGGGRGGGGGGGGGGTVVKAVAQLPSEAEVKESVSKLFTSWFRRAPSDAEVAGIKGMLDGVIIDEANKAAHARAYGGSYTESDKEALILDWIKKSPEYQQMFGKKPGGQTEEEYAGRFERAAEQIFGADMAGNDEAVRAGMVTGSSQTTLGQLAGSKEANDSSNYQERVANAAQIIARLT